MQKTKLGLSVGIVAAISYLMFFYGGLVAGLLVAGYILVCENDSWLKRVALKALALTLAFSVVNTLIYLLPSLLNVFNNMVAIFGGYLRLTIISNIAEFLSSIVNIFELVAYIGLAIMALFGKSINFKPLDKLID